MNKNGLVTGVTVGKQFLPQTAVGQVFLRDKTQFQIYLKNQSSDVVMVKIKVNDKFIGDGLILKPFQKLFLDRDLNDSKKFIFNTYEVDSQDYDRVKSFNGKIDIYQYKRHTDPVITTAYV